MKAPLADAFALGHLATVIDFHLSRCKANAPAMLRLVSKLHCNQLGKGHQPLPSYSIHVGV